jgi:hypothetical protein
MRDAEAKLNTLAPISNATKARPAPFDVAAQSTAVLSRQAGIEAEWRQSRTDKLAAIAQVNQLRHAGIEPCPNHYLCRRHCAGASFGISQSAP